MLFFAPSMWSRPQASFLSLCLVALASSLRASQPTVITGQVVGRAMKPVGGATVEVVRPASEPACRTRTADDGSFSLTCDATGRYVVRASLVDHRPWDADVELAPGAEVYLNFLLMPGEGPGVDAAPSDEPPSAGDFWSRPVPNPVLGNWGATRITLRFAAVVTAVVSFVFGALTMLSLGRFFGMRTRQLTASEVADLTLNPQRPAVGERVTPVAVAGARGGEATVSYGTAEVAAALEAGHFLQVFLALILAPGAFALASLAMAVAMLIGHETYLLVAALLVPAGFVLTAIIIGVHAFARRAPHGASIQPDQGS